MQLRSHRNFKKTQFEFALDLNGKFPLFLFQLCINIFVLITQIEALTTQLRKMRCKRKQKRCNFVITEILKRHNFEAEAEQGDANWGFNGL